MRAPAGGDPFVTVFGAVLDQESAARAALAEFVADVGADSDQAIYASGSYRETKRYLAEYDVIAGARRPVQREPDHSYSKSEFFRRGLPPDAVDELLAYFAHSRHARVLDFTPWAGAYNRVPTDATAFAHRAERFLLKQEVVVDPGASETERQAARGWLLSSWALVHAWGSDGVPELPRPRARGLGPRLPRREPRPAQAGEGDVRSRQRLPVRSVGPAHLASVSVTRVTAFTAAESLADKLVAGTTLVDVDWNDPRAEWVPT